MSNTIGSGNDFWSKRITPQEASETNVKEPEKRQADSNDIDAMYSIYLRYTELGHGDNSPVLIQEIQEYINSNNINLNVEDIKLTLISRYKTENPNAEVQNEEGNKALSEYLDYMESYQAELTAQGLQEGEFTKEDILSQIETQKAALANLENNISSIETNKTSVETALSLITLLEMPDRSDYIYGFNEVAEDQYQSDLDAYNKQQEYIKQLNAQLEQLESELESTKQTIEQTSTDIESLEAKLTNLDEEVTGNTRAGARGGEDTSNVHGEESIESKNTNVSVGISDKDQNSSIEGYTQQNLTVTSPNGEIFNIGLYIKEDIDIVTLNKLINNLKETITNMPSDALNDLIVECKNILITDISDDGKHKDTSIFAQAFGDLNQIVIAANKCQDINAEDFMAVLTHELGHLVDHALYDDPGFYYYLTDDINGSFDMFKEDLKAIDIGQNKGAHVFDNVNEAFADYYAYVNGVQTNVSTGGPKTQLDLLQQLLDDVNSLSDKELTEKYNIPVEQAKSLAEAWNKCKTAFDSIIEKTRNCSKEDRISTLYDQPMTDVYYYTKKRELAEIAQRFNLRTVEQMLNYMREHDMDPKDYGCNLGLIINELAHKGVSIPEGFSLENGDTYKSNEDGTVTFILKKDGKVSDVITMKGDNEVSSVEYKYNDDGTIAEKITTNTFIDENYVPSELPENGKVKVEKETTTLKDGTTVSIQKEYDDDGNLVCVITTKVDKYGNLIDETKQDIKTTSSNPPLDIPDVFNVCFINNSIDVSNINIPSITGFNAEAFLQNVVDLMDWAGKGGNGSLANALYTWYKDGCVGNFHWEASDEQHPEEDLHVIDRPVYDLPDTSRGLGDKGYDDVFNNFGVGGGPVLNIWGEWVDSAPVTFIGNSNNNDVVITHY